VHDVADPYFGEIIRGLEDAATRNQYQVVACSSDRNAVRELDYVRSLLSYRADAIVFCGGGIRDRGYQKELDRLLGKYCAEGGAVVMLATQQFPAPSVTIDNAAAAKRMTSYLLEIGHRAIGFVSGPESIETSVERLAGYQAALREAGQDFRDHRVAPGRFTCQGGAEAAAILCERWPGLTAIFAANDVMAFGVLGELARRGIKVPDEISVAGFDDIQMAALFPTPLTTIQVPMHDLAREAVDLVVEQLRGKRPRSQTLPAPVVARASTASPGHR
jgi:LacI family transcriptional regulator